MLENEANHTDAQDYAVRLLGQSRQFVFSLVFATIGAIGLWQVTTGLEMALDFGVASYSAVMITSFVGGNGLYAGFFVPLLNRRIFGNDDLDLYAFGPAWTPTIVEWSNMFVRFALWAIPFLAVVGAPIAFAVTQSTIDQLAVSVAVANIGACHWGGRCGLDGVPTPSSDAPVRRAPQDCID